MSHSLIKKRNVLNRAKFLLFNASTELSLAWVGLSSMVFGLLLLWPGVSFHYPEYQILSKFAGETTWGALFLVQGSVMIWAMLAGYKTKFLFLSDTIVGTALWTITCLSILLSVYPPPADSATTLVLAITSWWIMVRYQIPDITSGDSINLHMKQESELR